MAESGVVPKALQNRPTLGVHERLYFDVFEELTDSRQIVMGERQPIAASEFLSHAILEGYTRSEAQDIWKFVRELDKAFLDFVRSKTPAKPTKTP